MVAGTPDLDLAWPAHKVPDMVPDALTGVGLQDVALVLRLMEAGAGRLVSARAAATIDLPDLKRRRARLEMLYVALDRFSTRQTVTPAALRHLMPGLLQSGSACIAGRAELSLDFELLLRCRALVSTDLGGWKAYPVRLSASWCDGSFRLSQRVGLTYSSTSPHSATMVRQMLEDAFLRQFGALPQVGSAAAAAWLVRHASLATPQSQRCTAEVTVKVDPRRGEFGLTELIERCESALSTVAQTSARRSDEQAFARLSGENPMNAEDAAARLHVALAGESAEIRVCHFDSLHAHNATAFATRADRGTI